MAAKKNFIKSAIKHPGAERKAAKKAGMSTHAYMEKEKHAPGKAGSRARLGLRLEAMHGAKVKHHSEHTEHNHYTDEKGKGHHTVHHRTETTYELPHRRKTAMQQIHGM